VKFLVLIFFCLVRYACPHGRINALFRAESRSPQNLFGFCGSLGIRIMSAASRYASSERAPENFAYAGESAPVAIPGNSPASAFDRAAGLKTVGDEALLRRLLRAFAEDHADDCRQIREALAGGDTALGHRIAHTLKSVAGLIGATALRQTAYMVEKTLAPESPKQAFELLGSALDLLKTLETQLRAAVEEARVFEESAPKEQRGPLLPDARKALELAQRLRPFLKAGNTGCFEMLDEIRTAFAPFGEEYRILVIRMENFEFASAAKMLETLVARIEGMVGERG
jgi:HPt (histidine-containing phosphotransfer) domain-containing protein